MELFHECYASVTNQSAMSAWLQVDDLIYHQFQNSEGSGMMMI